MKVQVVRAIAVGRIAAFEVPAAKPESPLIAAINLYVYKKSFNSKYKTPDVNGGDPVRFYSLIQMTIAGKNIKLINA